MAEQRTFNIRNLFRRTTPKPADRQVFNMGIQEKNTSQLLTSPIIYHLASNSTVVRTCTTQLKQEVFRRGYTWEEKFLRNGKKCLFLGQKCTLFHYSFLEKTRNLTCDFELFSDAR